jgi:hypothetical protein
MHSTSEYKQTRHNVSHEHFKPLNGQPMTMQGVTNMIQNKIIPVWDVTTKENHNGWISRVDIDVKYYNLL